MTRITAALAGCSLAAFVTLLPSPFPAAAEGPMAVTKPQIALAAPLGIEPGTTKKIVLRGWNLAGAERAEIVGSTVEVKIVSKGGAQVPNRLDAKRIGDEQVELEFTAPAEFSGDALPLVIHTPQGASPPHEVLLGGSLPYIVEAEPNDGFAKPQQIELPRCVEARFERERDVDVYRFSAPAGATFHAETIAAARNSAADTILSIYSTAGELLAVNDDSENSSDSRLQVSLPTGGEYLVVVQEAHDLGGGAHPYRLLLRLAP